MNLTIKPKLAIIGKSRAGKDTAGLYIGEISDLRYNGSLSKIVNPLIAKSLGISQEGSWRTRHKHPEFWRDWCNNFRKQDPLRIIRQAVQECDIIIGIRSRDEFCAACSNNLIDLTIWIENPKVPEDITLELTQDDADIIITNTATIKDFKRKLYNFIKFTGLLRK